MDKLLSLVMDIGEQMLISGAEVHRVEESIKRMCVALGAKRVDIFIITSSMIATVFDDDGKTYSQTRRITVAITDFEKLHRLNQLSRKICNQNLSLEEIKNEYDLAIKSKEYPFWVECICYSIISGAFTVFFGGSIIEMLVSLVIGFSIRFGILFSDMVVGNKIFSKFICSVFATLLAFLAVRINIIANVDKVIIGNIMTLIPGVGLTNALRDLFTGDSIAGLLRCIEALLMALAIASGYFLVTILGGAVL